MSHPLLEIISELKKHPPSGILAPLLAEPVAVELIDPLGRPYEVWIRRVTLMPHGFLALTTSSNAKSTEGNGYQLLILSEANLVEFLGGKNAE